MSSSVYQSAILFSFGLLTSATSFAQATADTKNKGQLVIASDLSAQPAKCVTLTQGRTCFATITLNWQAAEVGNYCIYQLGQLKALQCWRNQQANNVTLAFESDKTIEYQLITIEQNRIIAETKVEVSWVHKASPRKRRWRLF